MNQVFWGGGGGFVFLAIRKIFAPGEEENLELEEEEDATAGAGSTEAFPPRAPGALHLFITCLSSHVIVTCCRVLEDHLTVCVCFFFCLFCWCRAWLHRSFPPASLAALQGTAYE